MELQVSASDGTLEHTLTNCDLCDLKGRNYSASDVIATSRASLGKVDRVSELEYELKRAYETIGAQKAKNNRLTHMQNVVDSEVQELTEKLFQEAYKMVNSAEERREKAEKLLTESRLKVDMLSVEVEALKAILKAPTQKASFSHLFMNSSSKTTPLRRVTGRSHKIAEDTSTFAARSQDHEIDPIYYREFADWREDGMKLDFTSPFLKRIMDEDIRPCLTFDNEKLASSVLDAIINNTLELEPSHEKKTSVKTCALTKLQKHCPYKLRVNSDCDWVYITQLCRNRIAAVCDFYTYVRYMHLGIVKAGLNDSYWDVIHHRRNTALAKCGLGYVSKASSGFCSFSE
uniref:Sec2p domain-containing protein n=1 Tax=Steinernema glaseri TaxID=37863 RepID=A0A1I7ZKA8_9BILA